MDIYGMFVAGLITGTGGGALRSVLIGDVPPAVFTIPHYFIVAALATLLAYSLESFFLKMTRAVSFFDALGLGFFVCLGVRTGQLHDLPWWSCTAMGVITATFGGVIRDIIRNEVPLVFRREIYATACIIGGVILIGLDNMGVQNSLAMAIATFSVALIRVLAIRYAINQSHA